VNRILLALTALTLFALTPAGSFAEDTGLIVHEPWVREMPAVSANSAAYMRIENTTRADRTLESVESAQFARVEIHESVDEDGMMRMRHLGQLSIPANGEVVLEPGGYHIMLMGRLGDPVVAGDQVLLRLTFDDGSSLDVTAIVTRQGPPADSHGTRHH
jgi:periplasmic copper chaperone A